MQLYQNTKVYVCDKLTTIYPKFKDNEMCKAFPIFIVIGGHLDGFHIDKDKDEYMMSISLDPINLSSDFDKTSEFIDYPLSSLNKIVFLSNEDAQLKATRLNTTTINSIMPLSSEMEAIYRREYDMLSKLKIGDNINFVKCNGYMTTGRIEKFIISDEYSKEVHGSNIGTEILVLVSEINEKEKDNIKVTNGVYLKADHMRDDKLFCCTAIWRYEL